MQDVLAQSSGTPQAAATFAASIVALVASVVTMRGTRRTQRVLAERQETLQQELAERQGELQGEIESTKDLLERARSFDVLTRERIINRFDSALKSHSVLSTYSHLVGRDPWVRQQGAAAIEDRVQSEASSLRGGLEFLRFIGAMPEAAYERCVTACSKVTWAWERVLSELTLKYGEDLGAGRQAPREFSPSRFTDRHTELRVDTDELGSVLFDSFTRITVPV